MKTCRNRKDSSSYFDYCVGNWFEFGEKMILLPWGNLYKQQCARHWKSWEKFSTRKTETHLNIIVDLV